jgi:hypothetical protein
MKTGVAAAASLQGQIRFHLVADTPRGSGAGGRRLPIWSRNSLSDCQTEELPTRPSLRYGFTILHPNAPRPWPHRQVAGLVAEALLVIAGPSPLVARLVACWGRTDSAGGRPFPTGGSNASACSPTKKGLAFGPSSANAESCKTDRGGARGSPAAGHLHLPLAEEAIRTSLRRPPRGLAIVQSRQSAASEASPARAAREMRTEAPGAGMPASHADVGMAAARTMLALERTGRDLATSEKLGRAILLWKRSARHWLSMPLVSGTARVAPGVHGPRRELPGPWDRHRQDLLTWWKTSSCGGWHGQPRDPPSIGHYGDCGGN